MKTAIEAALAQVDRDRDEILGFLQSMIRLQPSGEAAVQAAVADRLRAAGASLESIAYEPSTIPVVDEFAAETHVVRGERMSVVGTFSAAREGGRGLILFAHPDGEPIGDTADWTHDPFAGIIDGNRLYGWGVADDLAGVACAASAMAVLKDAGIGLSGNVVVASTPSKRHARGVAAVLHRGYDADAAIYLHPAESGVGMNEIKAFSSGQLEFSVDIEGRAPATTEPGHTAFAHTAINPLDKAIILIDALKALDAARAARVRHPLLDDFIGRSSNILLSSVQFGGTRAFSRLPLHLTLSGAISFPPQEKLKDVQAEVEAALDAAARSDPWLSEKKPVLRWVSGVSGMEVPEDHPLYQVVGGAVRRVAGIDPHVNPMHTSSDIRNPFVQKGIPTVGLGPFCGDLTQTGRHDEWVDVEDYIRAVKVTVVSIIEWCGA